LLSVVCYLGDMLSVNGDADVAVEARIRIGWNKFRQLVPLLTNRDISLIRRRRLYSSCVRSSMLHGSETWPVRKENEVALQRAEMTMVRWMCNVKVKDRVPSKVKGKGKGFPYLTPSVGPGADPGVQAVSLQVTVSHPPGGRLPLLSTRPAVTSPATEHHRPLAGTKLYCLVTEAHRCKQLA